MEKISSDYVNLSELTREFSTGLIIVQQTLFDVTDKIVDSSYELDGETIEEKVISARKILELDDRARIVYDDLDVYDEYIVSEEGMLVTAFEADRLMDEEEREGWEDIADYYKK